MYSTYSRNSARKHNVTSLAIINLSVQTMAHSKYVTASLPLAPHLKPPSSHPSTRIPYIYVGALS